MPSGVAGMLPIREAPYAADILRSDNFFGDAFVDI